MVRHTLVIIAAEAMFLAIAGAASRCGRFQDGQCRAAG